MLPTFNARRFVSGVLLCLAAGSAHAQPKAAAPATPAPAAAASTPATTAGAPASAEAAAAPTATPAEAAPPPASGCFPACREGFVCYVDRCVSACNPPCARDERCTASGQCERTAGLAETALPVPPPPAAPDLEASPELAPGYRRHDGFMLRLAAGVGAGGIHDDGDNDWSGAGFFSFDIGGAPIENFALHFRMSHYGFDPENGPNQADRIGVGTWGMGATWYLMPANVYLTPSLGFAAISFARSERERDDWDIKGGLGAGLDVGKEWWVGGSWGLGLAARLNYVVVDNYSATGLAILFSATYQ